MFARSSYKYLTSSVLEAYFGDKSFFRATHKAGSTIINLRTKTP